MDCFAILGLPPTASIDEIGKAFRRLAQKVHPDHRPGAATASCEFQRLHEAYLDAIVQAGQREQTSEGAFNFGGRAYMRQTDGRVLQWNAMARSWTPISGGTLPFAAHLAGRGVGRIARWWRSGA